MPNFLVRPRVYHDQLDALYAYLKKQQEAGRSFDITRNPNGKLEMIVWAYDEILRLRGLAGEHAQARKPLTWE